MIVGKQGRTPLIQYEGATPPPSHTNSRRESPEGARSTVSEEKMPITPDSRSVADFRSLDQHSHLQEQITFHQHPDSMTDHQDQIHNDSHLLNCVDSQHMQQQYQQSRQTQRYIPTEHRGDGLENNSYAHAYQCYPEVYTSNDLVAQSQYSEILRMLQNNIMIRPQDIPQRRDQQLRVEHSMDILQCCIMFGAIAIFFKLLNLVFPE